MELLGDLVNGVMAIAKLNDFEAGALEAERLLGSEEHARELGFLVEAYAGGETGSGGKFRLHRVSSARRNP